MTAKELNKNFQTFRSDVEDSVLAIAKKLDELQKEVDRLTVEIALLKQPKPWYKFW